MAVYVAVGGVRVGTLVKVVVPETVGPLLVSMLEVVRENVGVVLGVLLRGLTDTVVVRVTEAEGL